VYNVRSHFVPEHLFLTVRDGDVDRRASMRRYSEMVGDSIRSLVGPRWAGRIIVEPFHMDDLHLAVNAPPDLATVAERTLDRVMQAIEKRIEEIRSGHQWVVRTV
jgi:hypothetical protein